MRTRRLVLCTALALAVSAPGIASGADTRAEFISKADPICKATNRAAAKDQIRIDRLLDESMFREAGVIVLSSADRLGQSVGRVRAIGFPPGDEALLAKWLGLKEKQVDAFAGFGRALKKNRLRRADRLLTRALQIKSRSGDLIDDYGFNHCGP